MRDLIVLGLVVPISLVALFRPWIGVLGWFWISMMNPHRMTWGFAYNMQVAAIVAIPTLIGLMFTRERKAIPFTKEVCLLLALWGYFAFTTMSAYLPTMALAYLEKISKVLLMTFVAIVLIHGKRKILALTAVVTLSIAFFGVKGGLFSLLTGGESRVRGPEESFIGSNNDLGIALAMIVPILFELGAQLRSRWMRWSAFLAGWLCVLSVIFTYSRGAMVGLLAIGIVMFFRSRHKAAVSLLMSSIVVFVFAFAPDKLFDRAETIKSYEADESAMQRLQAWSVAVGIARERPWVGGGFEIASLPNEVWLSYANREYDAWGQEARAAHSIYFQVLGEHGFAVLGLFLLLMLFTYLSLGKVARHCMASDDTTWMRPLAIGLQTGLFAYAIAGAFLSLAYFDLYYVIVALAVILSRELGQLNGATLRRPVAVIAKA